MSNYKLEIARIIEGLQMAQKKGCFNLDEAAVIHSSIVKVQKMDFSLLDGNSDSSEKVNTLQKEKEHLSTQIQQVVNERNQLVQLLEEYKKAIEEFKKQHDAYVFKLKVVEEKNKELEIKLSQTNTSKNTDQESKIKELQTQLKIYEKENTELKNDLTELINADSEEEDIVIPVVKEKPAKKPKKVKS